MVDEEMILKLLDDKIKEIEVKVKKAYAASYSNCGNCESCDQTWEILETLLEKGGINMAEEMVEITKEEYEEL